MLTHIAESDERGQQNGQRQRRGNERNGHIPKKLRQNVERQSFAYEFIDVAPSELHHKDEKANAKGSHKQREELFENIEVESFDEAHPEWVCSSEQCGQREEACAIAAFDENEPALDGLLREFLCDFLHIGKVAE